MLFFLGEASRKALKLVTSIVPGILSVVTKHDLRLLYLLIEAPVSVSLADRLEFLLKIKLGIEPLEIIEFYPSYCVRFETGRIPGTIDDTNFKIV